MGNRPLEAHLVMVGRRRDGKCCSKAASTWSSLLEAADPPEKQGDDR